MLHIFAMCFHLAVAAVTLTQLVNNRIKSKLVLLCFLFNGIGFAVNLMIIIEKLNLA